MFNTTQRTFFHVDDDGTNLIILPRWNDNSNEIHSTKSFESNQWYEIILITLLIALLMIICLLLHYQRLILYHISTCLEKLRRGKEQVERIRILEQSSSSNGNFSTLSTKQTP